jgi:integrase
MSLTGWRWSEVAQARWHDIDFAGKRRHLPDTKNVRPQFENEREHIVPLSVQAIALLRSRMPEKPATNFFVSVSADEGDGHTPLANWDRATKASWSQAGHRTVAVMIYAAQVQQCSATWAWRRTWSRRH